MNRDPKYHKAAIQYNEEMAAFAEGLAERLPHREIVRWARSIAKQHRFHASQHKRSLSRIERSMNKAQSEDESEKEQYVDRPMDEQQAEYAAAKSQKES